MAEFKLSYTASEINEKLGKVDEPRSWNELEDKPFYEAEEIVNEPLNITWDGNTEGLVSVVFEEGVGYYKVSDDVFTNEQIKLMTRTLNNFGNPHVMQIDVIWETLVEDGNVTEDFVVADFDWMFIFVRKAGATIDGIVFPEVGVYFFKEADDYYMQSLTTTEPVEHTKTVVHKLDKKYLPDDVGGSVKVFYASFDDDYLYHDKETTMKVSKDEYLLALSSGVVTIATSDGYKVFYPSLNELNGDFAAVSLWNYAEWWTVYTSEKPPVLPS